MIMKRNFTQSNYSESWLENNIVYQVISPKVTKINLEIAKQLVKDRTQAMGAIIIPLPVYVIVNNATSIDPEAKKFYKQPEAYENIRCIGMLVDNYAARIVGNLVFTINRPRVPTTLFNDEAKALKWLEQFEFPN